MRIITALIAGAAASALLAGAAQAQDTSIAWKGAPQFANDSLTFKVRGRVYYDVVSQDVDFANPAVTDVDTQASRLRTARLGVEGTWNQNWAYKAEFQLVGGAAAWEDLILEYKPNDTTSIMLGNFKTVSFENISSSRYNTFLERGAYSDLLNAGRVMSAQVKMNGENWTAAGFITGDSVNNADPAVGSSEQFAVGARGTYSPILTDTTKVHLGGSVRMTDRGQGTSSLFNYQARNNTNLGNRYVSTGAVGEKDTQFIAEGLLIHKNLSLQGEYMTTKFERTSGVEQDINSYFVAASWFVTGETRNLEAKKGEIGRTKILNPMTAGGLGALELAVRYDAADLTDAFTDAVVGPPVVAAISPNAGKYSAVTVGANWYPFPYTRFMINYTDADNDLTPLATSLTTDPDVNVKTIQFRAQFDF